MTIQSSQSPEFSRAGRIRRLLRGAGLVPAAAAISLLAGAERAPVAIKDVRYWSLGDVARVAIETTGDFRYTFDRLSSPPRIYFDIHNATHRVSRERIHTVPVGDGLIDRIRLSQNTRTVTRIVLDLAGSWEVTSSQLANPDRLMIEVRGSGAKPVIVEKQPHAPPVSAAKPAVRAPADTTARRETPDRTEPVNRREQAPRKPPAPKSESPAPARPSAPVRASASAAAPSAPSVSAPAAEDPVAVAAAAADRALDIAAGKAEAPAPEPAATEKEKEESLIAQPARSNRAGGHSLTRVLGLKLGRIVIDPGHGGRDTGTIGPTGLREKDVTLDVAQRLAKLIGEGMGSEVVLTRTGDESVSLAERTERANKARADLFISLHVNSSRYRTVNGVETFFLNLTRSRADLEVAARENAGSDKSIHELTSLLQKIAADDKVQESQDLAASIQSAVYKLHRKYDGKARNRGVKKAPFVVLIGAQMPSVLVEMGFISNAREEKLMKKPEYVQEIAAALYEGISAYASSLSHFQVASAGGGGE